MKFECVDCGLTDRETLIVGAWLADEQAYGFLCWDHAKVHNLGLPEKEWITPFL